MQPYSSSTDSIYQRNVLKRRRSSTVMTGSTFPGLRCTGATAFVKRPSPVVSRLPARQFHALSSGNAKSQLRRVSSCSHPALSASVSTCTSEHWLGGTRKYGMQALLSTSCPRPVNTQRMLQRLLFGKISSVALLAGRQAGRDKRTEC